MEIKNDSIKGTPQVKQERKNRKPHDKHRSLGDVSIEGAGDGIDEIGTLGEDRTRTDLTQLSTRTESNGGILRRLIAELEHQLAYHKEQSKFLDLALERVKNLPEVEKIDLTE